MRLAQRSEVRSRGLESWVPPAVGIEKEWIGTKAAEFTYSK